MSAGPRIIDSHRYAAQAVGAMSLAISQRRPVSVATLKQWQFWLEQAQRELGAAIAPDHLLDGAHNRPRFNTRMDEIDL